ncbi:MAG: lipoate--protein ligase family protein [Thermoanaerobaculaceae bacterium]
MRHPVVTPLSPWGQDWVVLGAPSAQAALHTAWDLLALSPPQLRVAPVAEVVVVLPRSRDPGREVYLERCQADGVRVVLRPSGGGAVVLAPGMVTVSALVPLSGDRSVDRLFARFCGWLAEGLRRCGVKGLSQMGVSDLCIGRRKLAGSSLRLLRSAVLFQASILVDCSLELIARYLPYPSRAPDYRQGRDHRTFLTTLRQEGYPLEPSDVVRSLYAVFSRALCSV